MAVKEDHLKKFSFPLQTVTEMNRLDDEIRNNEAFKNQLIDFLSRVGGSSGQNDATKVAYKISDMLFSSEILTHYSWTGISKRKENPEKQSFTALKKVIEVFFEVLSKSDNRHTKEKNDKIIRDGILKHAKKRYERKRQQIGAKKDLVTADDEVQNKSNEGNNDIEQTEDNNQPNDKDSDSEIIN
ncbi:unnamed protein product [Brassicogethes aeneus]|uniref:DUF4806 domain-containing protein n=1 Tax=Brassicogethes aeneus TaxID=1431903 RepID=A0A9P0FHJ2_BRAAE|nr:unnamed protein product [Brassicogethes aeneus]